MKSDNYAENHRIGNVHIISSRTYFLKQVITCFQILVGTELPKEDENIKIMGYAILNKIFMNSYKKLCPLRGLGHHVQPRMLISDLCHASLLTLSIRTLFTGLGLKTNESSITSYEDATTS